MGMSYAPVGELQTKMGRDGEMHCELLHFLFILSSRCFSRIINESVVEAWGMLMT